MKPYSLILTLLFLGACQSAEVPKGILPLKKMSAVVKEITLNKFFCADWLAVW